MQHIIKEIIEFGIVLGIMVLIHELGHFAVAKWCGVRVETFSIGFGTRLFGFRRGDEIVLVFCGSKKSLVAGIPMATVLFGSATAGIILLPIMIFHQIQLMVCAVLAKRYAQGAPLQAASVPAE